MQNISYYSCISNENKNVKIDYLPDYKRDGATLLVDRIKRQLRKAFKPLKLLYQSKMTIADLKSTKRDGLNTSYSTIQPEINRKRNLSKNRESNMRGASNSRKSNKSLR